MWNSPVWLRRPGSQPWDTMHLPTPLADSSPLEMQLQWLERRRRLRCQMESNGDVYPTPPGMPSRTSRPPS